jgi:hypothetical protein
MEIIFLASTSNSDVRNAIKLLRPSKSVGLDGIPSFVLKDWSEMLYLFSSLYISNLNLSLNNFLNVCKQAAIVRLRKGKIKVLLAFTISAFLNNFSNAFVFIIHDQVSH